MSSAMLVSRFNRIKLIFTEILEELMKSTILPAFEKEGVVKRVNGSKKDVQKRPRQKASDAAARSASSVVPNCNASAAKCKSFGHRRSKKSVGSDQRSVLQLSEAASAASTHTGCNNAAKAKAENWKEIQIKRHGEELKALSITKGLVSFETVAYI